MKKKIFDRGCGIAVIRMNQEKNRYEVLIGERFDGQGWCLAGGKIENDEHPYEAACRELREEFNLEASLLHYLGRSTSHAVVRGEEDMVKDYVFMCLDFEGEIIHQEGEINRTLWVDLFNIPEGLKLFPPAIVAINFAIMGLSEFLFEQTQ
jgi:8-oxo-dGTP pyrophosphatase MutT (NUDIX family)